MNVVRYFKVRITCVLYSVMNLVRSNPKKVEAIGLLIILVAGFFQLQADSYRLWMLNYDIGEIRGEITFTRQQVMGMIECQSHSACDNWQRELTKPESDSFISIGALGRRDIWQTIKNIAFIIGTIMICLSKWLE